MHAYFQRFAHGKNKVYTYILNKIRKCVYITHKLYIREVSAKKACERANPVFSKGIACARSVQEACAHAKRAERGRI